MHIVCTFACNMQNGAAPRHSHLQHAFSIKLAPLPQNVGNFIHCTAIFQAISFSIRYSILFFCLLLCFLELHIYPGLGRAEQGRPGSFGVAQRRSRSSKSSKSRGLFGAAACSGGKVDEGEGGKGAEAGAHLDGFTFGREACFDTGELNTIVQYLFNVNEKRQTRQDERGNGVESCGRRACSIQFYAHIFEAVVRNDIEHCVDSSLFLSPSVCAQCANAFEQIKIGN